MNKKHTTKTEEDISWYYLFSEADCGFRSNWSAMVNVKIFGSRPWDDNMYAYLDAVAKRRRIQNALLQIPTHLVDILHASFTNINFPAPISKFFKEYSGAAAHTNLTTPQHLYQLCAKLYNSSISEQERLLLDKIYAVSKDEYEQAITIYYQTSKKRK